MEKYKIYLIAEAIIILLPVSLIALLGGGYIIVLQLGEKISFTPFNAILIVVITSSMLASLASLWMILIRTVKKGIWAGVSIKLPCVLADLGGLFSVFVLLELMFITLNGRSTGYTTLYVFGTPALIPYVHLLYINGGLLTSDNGIWSKAP